MIIYKYELYIFSIYTDPTQH